MATPCSAAALKAAIGPLVNYSSHQKLAMRVMLLALVIQKTGGPDYTLPATLIAASNELSQKANDAELEAMLVYALEVMAIAAGVPPSDFTSAQGHTIVNQATSLMSNHDLHAAEAFLWCILSQP